MGTQRVQIVLLVLPWLVRWACCAGTRDFCPALAALVGPVQNIFSSPYTISMPLSLLPNKLGRQTCRVACLQYYRSVAMHSLFDNKGNLPPDYCKWFMNMKFTHSAACLYLQNTGPDIRNIDGCFEKKKYLERGKDCNHQNCVGWRGGGGVGWGGGWVGSGVNTITSKNNVISRVLSSDWICMRYRTSMYKYLLVRRTKK